MGESLLLNMLIYYSKQELLEESCYILDPNWNLRENMVHLHRVMCSGITFRSAGIAVSALQYQRRTATEQCYLHPQ
jgi:hypothetical protein